MKRIFILETNKGNLTFNFSDKNEVEKIKETRGQEIIEDVEECDDTTQLHTYFSYYFIGLKVAELINFLYNFYSQDENLMYAALEYLEDSNIENYYLLKKVVKFVKEKKIEYIFDTQGRDFDEVIKELIDFGFIKPIDKFYMSFIDYQELYDYLLDKENFFEFDLMLFKIYK